MEKDQIKRIKIIEIFIIVSLSCILMRVYYLQNICQDYKKLSTKNFVRASKNQSIRGIIVDRNGNILVRNKIIYDLFVIPRNTKKLNITNFCLDLGIPRSVYEYKIKKAIKYSPFKPSVFIKNLTDMHVAKIIDKINDYPGFYIKHRFIRDYPSKILSLILGYVSMNNDGECIGETGVEKIYDKQLTGIAGTMYNIVDVNETIVMKYNEGKDDIDPVNGKNLTLTIDCKLQKFCEELLQNLTGAIVVIDPRNGEILSIVSSPSYDPNLLNRTNDFTDNYLKLTKDNNSPLLNRAIMSTYPMGSMFKIVQALIALNNGIINPNDKIICSGKKIKCRTHPNPVNMHLAIKYSCNEYFFNIFQKTLTHKSHEEIENKIDTWHNNVTTFGLGKKLDIDLPYEKSGFVPDSDFYNKLYGKNKWNNMTVRSLDIGQGELLATPLQMANLAAILCNKGFYYNPHIVKRDNNEKHTIQIEERFFSFISDIMDKCVTSGTGQNAYVKGLNVHGKTSTIQNTGDDHSAFIGFEPNCNIALVVFVEHGGWGSGKAATLAGKIFKFCKDTNDMSNYR